MTDPALQDPWGEPLFTRTEVRLYRKEPDYSRPPLTLAEDKARVIKEKLALLYAERAEACYSEIERILRVHHAHKTSEMLEDEEAFRPEDRFTEKDIVAITYPDQLIKPGVLPLAFLGQLLNIYLTGIINTIHILPFYPYSSDRGFSVIDYRQVDPRMGTWDDIERLSLSFHLMFDGVINHVSSKSEWFEEFLNGNPEYEDFFTVFDTTHELTEDHRRLILRPRTSDLLTPFQTINGTRYVWTTFSSDQIDLNYKNEKVLFRILDILLYYVRKGADLLRLDAATYLWAELGTSCAHLLETHALVQLLRAVFDVAAPKVSLITETNVPHADNISYFGDGTNEAHMVYNFSLPPLVLHSIHTGNCEKLTLWAAQLEKPSELCTYFNFLDSHDGIGLLGARDILTDGEIEALVKKVESHGGLVSYRADSQGSISPYELNITWFNALNSPNGSDSDDEKVNRFIASRAILLALAGVPAVYLPGIAGTQLVEQVKLEDLDESRSISRQRGDPAAFGEKMTDSSSVAFRIVKRFRELAERRNSCPAFHPNGPQRVVSGNSEVFTLVRKSPDGSRTVLALTNVSGHEQRARVENEQVGVTARAWKDMLGDRTVPSEDGGLELELKP